MCGIAGIVSDDPTLRDQSTLRQMLGAIKHRGPDDEGTAIAGGCSLGVRRLAVIDIDGGHQPMTNEAEDVFAIQNGEIYNFGALRSELEDGGHRFRTRSDTEILPHAYEQWGDAFVERLRGMFAIALWDDRRKRLLLTRDRFGKKPLHYAVTADGLIFGSEIQALMRHRSVERAIDDEAIDDYLTLGYIPAPKTAFAQIRKLEPGHVLTYERGNCSTRSYWKLQFAPKLDLSFDEAASELRRRIEDAVAVRLVSDVPIGAFLSGGLDSSTVVAYMAKRSSRPVDTFSVGFRSPRHDELAYARIVARAFGTNHHELVVDEAQTDALPALVRHVGEPFADSSIIPTFYVAQATRAHVTVALTGDGGDELFAGYDRYKAAALAKMTVERLPRVVRRSVAAVAGRIPQDVRLPPSIARARRFLIASGREPEARYVEWSGYFTGKLRGWIQGDRLRSHVRDPQSDVLSRARVEHNALGAAETFMAADLTMGLPGDLLVKMDIATMANSLEARSPFLDHELAEFVARLPSAYKLSPTRSKILLRRAMHGVLPPEILARGKMGFSAPVGDWLRGPLRSLFQEVALSQVATARGYVDGAAADSLFKEHTGGSADHTRLLWCLLVLELWFRECVGSTSAARN